MFRPVAQHLISLARFYCIDFPNMAFSQPSHCLSQADADFDDAISLREFVEFFLKEKVWYFSSIFLQLILICAMQRSMGEKIASNSLTWFESIFELIPKLGGGVKESHFTTHVRQELEKSWEREEARFA